ncbi:maleylpyruvate isomerase [Acrocarpospora corrugata]|uniref:Maleylpyruvate isomerase n=1 Tax=Acrocarpospora corrugata TaxID=35763 RepID=A0A5M3VXY3_9ACTN|nr:maleylpyruvate isomerase family mycothiol-dependent enzyme [Acrocarpospora corrugata]GES00770.1 maleylpyruvate isomerase [Acrocarpospora corrugata]
MSLLDRYQSELSAATARLLTTVAALTDADIQEPSRLPGWTRGHVITHVARSGDSLINLLTSARTGLVIPQYPSMAVRDADIEAGAGRPAKEQFADLDESAARFLAATRELSAGDWTVRVTGNRPPDHPAWYLLMRRLREVEIHHGDLGLGYDWADWPEQYVVWDFHDTMRMWKPGSGPLSEVVVVEGDAPGETWTGLGEGVRVEGTRRDLLAWLAGRTSGDRLNADGPLPSPPGWPFQSAPEGLPSEIPDSWPPVI